jgi:hypothetical protein
MYAHLPLNSKAKEIDGELEKLGFSECLCLANLKEF